MKAVVALVIGIMLFCGGLVGGLLLQSYLYSSQPQDQGGFERLAVQSFVSKPFTKMGMGFSLRNTGTSDLQIASVMINGYLNQSLAGLNQGWNGTTALSPNQTALLYVYYPCYAQAFNDSIPRFSGSPSETELIIRAYGMSPEQVLTKEALNQPARTQVNPDEYQNTQLQTLSKALRELIRKDTAETMQTVHIRTVIGGPDGN